MNQTGKVKRLRFVMTVPPKSEVRLVHEDTEVSFVPMEAIGEEGQIQTDRTKRIGEVMNGYTYFGEGDVVMAKITPCFENGKGAIASQLVNGIGFGTTELHVLRAGRDLDSRFLFYVTRSHDFRKLGEAEMYGAGGQKRVPESFVRNFRAYVPSVGEQRAIADFLDRETTMIDHLLRQKQRFLQLTDDSRRAVVARAVTRGIRGGPLVPSGIEWFGSVPQHWIVNRLGRLAVEINDVNHEMPDAVEDGVPFLSAKDLKDDGSLNFSEDVKLISREAFARLGAKITPKRGDIVYSRYGACLGKARLVETDREFLVSYSCVIIRLRKDVADPKFFAYLLDSDLVLTDARLRTQGIAVPDLGNKMIAKFAVPVPPLDEQREITTWLDEKVSELRRLSYTIASAIRKVQELRVALISAAVTGQIDIPNYRSQEAAVLCQ
jgi:type I restriction enzyme S subunit